MNRAQTNYDFERLRSHLAGCAIGHTIDYHARVPSTMPIAHQRATESAVRSGTLILTDEQTAGRGRQNRRWETPAGEALLVSLILKAPLALPIHEVPMAAGLAAQQAIIACWPPLAGEVGLKWPNDLLLGRAMASAGKVGGILVESSFYGATLNHAIVGMGINLLQRAADLPPGLPGAPPPTSIHHYLATSRRQPVAGGESDHQPGRTDLLIALALAWAELLSEAAHTSLVQRWRAALWTLNQQVTVYQQPVTSMASEERTALSGEAIDVTDAGALLVRDGAGEIHTFAAGDVSVRLPATHG